MPTLKITTPQNPNYNGETFGVKFIEGTAILSEHHKPNRWGYSLADLAQKFQTRIDGYRVEWVGSDGAPRQGPLTEETPNMRGLRPAPAPVAAPRPVQADGRLCAHEGCGTPLSAKNRTGYCAKHWREARQPAAA